MFNPANIHIDQVSFWLGFVAASLLWWLAGRIRPLLPVWRDQYKAYINHIRQQRLAGIDGFLRNEAVRRAQTRHIASALFPLDDLLVQPKLLVPPAEPVPGEPAAELDIASRVLPYLPDFPEITAPYGIQTLTPLEAARSGRHIAIIGQPGTGKTIALASLACDLARKQIEDDHKLVPVYTHILEVFPPRDKDTDLFESILQDISSHAGVVFQPQFPKFFRSIEEDKERRLVLIVDGFDELPPKMLQESIKHLTSLIKEHPRFQIIVSASPDYLDGLLDCGFLPLGIAAWTADQRLVLAQKWDSSWKKHLVPVVNKLPEHQNQNPSLFAHWLNSEELPYFTPLEWTMRLWGAYSGCLSGSKPVDGMDAHFAQSLPNNAYLGAASDVAFRLIKNQTCLITFDEIDKIFSSSRPAQSSQDLTVSSSSEAVEPTASGKGEPESTKQKPKQARSTGEQIINRLIDGGILREYSNSNLGFTNPEFIGYLAAMRITPAEASQLSQKNNWSYLEETLHFAISQEDQPAWAMKIIEDPAPPLYREILRASRWLRDALPNSGWRTYLMRSLVILLQDEKIPFSIRMKFASAFFLSRDPSAGKLFKHLSEHKSSEVRRIGLIGLGSLGNPHTINDVLKLLADPIPEVRLTACLALSAFPGETALNGIVEIMMSGDEELRQAAAESLANNRIEGHKLLEEAAAIDDLLARRAAVFGLAKLRNPWAKKLLEKVAVEDSQWVVRNAAAQSLDLFQEGRNILPQQVPPPWESSWLLSFASKSGIGLTPGQDAIDILLRVMNTGSEQEQIAALLYLRNYDSETVISAVYQMMYGREEATQEHAANALWWMSLKGTELPSPVKFGVI